MNNSSDRNTPEAESSQVGVPRLSLTNSRGTRSACTKGKIVGQTWDKGHSGELIRDALLALRYLLPIGGASLAAVAILAWTDHVAAAWVVVGVGVLIGVAMARTSPAPRAPRRPRRARRQLSTVQCINRRATLVLPLSAVALATLMAGIAVKPAVLGLFAMFVLFPLATGLAALAVYELGHVVRRAVARGTEG